MSTVAEPVRVDRGADGVAHVVLDRAAKRNALDLELVGAIDAALRGVASDDGVRCVVVRGEGPAFCAGIDASTLKDLGSPEGLRTIRGAFADAWNLCETMPKPTIASVHGWAVGAGFELALACDLRVFADDVTVGLPETRMGVVPDVGGCARLASLVGLTAAKELILTSALVGPDRCRELGLANRIVARADLEAATAELAGQVAACSVVANGHAKRILDRAAKPALAETLDAELDAQLECIATDEYAAAAEAFARRLAG